MKMNDKMQKLIDAKKAAGKGVGGIEKSAKMHVVGAMKQMANDEINDRLGGLKKVSVASDSKDGLEKGLDKAKDILDVHSPMDESTGDSDGMDMSDDELAEDAGQNPSHGLGMSHDMLDSESGEEDHDDGSAMSDDDIDEQIKHLLMLKEQNKAQKA